MNRCDHADLVDIENFDFIRLTNTLASAAACFCSDCGLAFTRNYPTDPDEVKTINQDFDVSFEVSAERSTQKSEILDERISQLGIHKSEIRVIDFGGGTGRTARALRLRGYEAYSYDPFAAHDQTIDQEILLSPKDYALMLKATDETALCITLFHVLEHIPNPEHFLRELHEALPENSLLIIEVPILELEEEKSWDLSSFFAPFHATHFSRRTLGLLLASSGFEAVDRYEFEDYNGALVITRKTNDSTPPGVSMKGWMESGEDLKKIANYAIQRKETFLWFHDEVMKLLSKSNTIVIWGLGMGFENAYRHCSNLPWTSFMFTDVSEERRTSFRERFPELPVPTSPLGLSTVLQKSEASRVGLVPLSYAKSRVIERNFVDFIPVGSRFEALRFPKIRSY